MKHVPFPPRGGAPVGFVTELSMLETGFVVYLRLWCSGDACRRQVEKDFTLSLGAVRGRAALDSFDELCSICVHHGRRPLMRHEVNCKCLGADESCLANFVAIATEGEREDAMFIATLMVRPDLTPRVTALAQDVGVALKQMFLHAGTKVPYPPPHQTIH
jgi:hypothetical protein